MVSTKLNSLTFFTLSVVLMASVLADKNSAQTSLGEFQLNLPDSSLHVSLYSIPSLIDLASSFKQSSPLVWESENKVELPEITSFCYPASYYKALPKSDFYIIIDLVHQSQERSLTRCANSKFISYSIKVNEFKVSSAFSQALTLIALDRTETKNALIFFDSHNERMLQGPPQDCGDYFFDQNGVCVACIANCVTCSNSQTCDVCFGGSYDLLGYYRNDQGQCEICTKWECVSCRTSDTCSECYKGYALTDTFQCVECQDVNCKTCSDPAVCEECFESYFDNSGTCQACEVVGCLACSTANTCDVCFDGYFFNGQECSKCGFNCIKCDNFDTCTLCESGLFLSSGKCSPCSIFCEVCSDINTCTTCQSGYLLTQDSKCASCSMFCNHCNADYCLECYSGFYLNQDTQECEPCSDYCDKCINSDNCAVCYYGVNVNGRCQPCEDGCAFCDLDQCYECFKSYYLDQSTGSCVPCQSKGCRDCSKSQCFECHSDFFLVQETSTCESCGEGCGWCEEPNSCIYCYLGFYNDNGICRRCSTKNCLECENDVCTQCDYGYSFNADGLCYSCPDGCQICTDNGCELCRQGYYYDANDQWCYTCNYNCEVCYDGFTCEKCYNGTYFDSDYGYCDYCTYDCQNCRSYDVCDVCYEGFFIDENKQCSNCMYGCNKCQDSEYCFECHSGFFLDQDNSCKECMPNCNKCKDQEKCGQCVYGYYMNGDKCMPCSEFCEECNDNGFCIVCSFGRFVSPSGNCVTCVQGCDFCSDSETCNQCSKGFFLDDATQLCNPCMPNCNNCFDPFSCDSCNTTYFVNEYTRDDDTTAIECKKCPYGCKFCDSNACYECLDYFYKDFNNNECVECMENCKSCYIDSDNSLACEWCGEGSYLSDNQCIQCGENCNKCDEYGCYWCLPYFYPNEDGECTSCIDNCIGCWDDTYCFQCDQGYNYDWNNNQCTTCFENCLECDDDKVCQLCDDYFYADSDGFCQYCGYGCLTCDEETCYACDAGLYLDNYNECTYCPYECETCSSEDVCESCNSGFYLVVNEDLTAYCDYCTVTGCISCSKTECTQCDSRYHLEDGVCKTCPIDCYYCLTGNECIWCDNGHYVGTDSLCKKCSPGCEYCELDYSYDPPSEICYYCNYGYFQNQDGECRKCSSNCNECEDESLCNYCEDGYYISSSDSTCVSCKKYCLYCDNKYSCNQCYDGYYWSSKDSECKPCGNGCSECGAKGCLNCYEEFFLDNKNNCVHCSPNCILCSSIDVCDLCYPGYYYDESTKKCESCMEFCDDCSKDECYTCTWGFYLNDKGDECISCGDNCYQCDADQCYGCYYGYFIDGEGECSGCEENCDLCESETVCDECSWYYYLVVDGDEDYCEACSDNCMLCSADGCEWCEYGFYIDNNYECSQCIEGCVYCEDGSSCLQCDYHYYLDYSDFSCKPCKSEQCEVCYSADYCYNCTTGYLPDSLGNCKACPKNCDSCEIQSECQECSWGFFRGSTGQCLACPDYCNGCQTFGYCYGCETGFYQSLNGTCSKCMKDCDYCQNSTSCIQCSDGAFYNNGNCSRCAAGCSSCSDKKNCDECFDMFYLENGVCVPCKDPNCYSCSSNECFSCNLGYLLDSESNNCTACPYNCAVCSSNSTCDTCFDGFFMNSNDNQPICSPCDGNCATCSKYKFCDSCIEGAYMKEEGKCSKCTSKCLECDSKSCFVCENGYYINSAGTCANCGKNCSKCQDKDICQGCFEGFYLESDGTCKNCGTNCAACSNKYSCDRCTKGFLLQSDNTCSKCVKGCATCDEAGVCSECLSGYKFTDNTCFACTDIKVDSVKIDEDFKRVKIKMVSVIDKKDLNCKNAIATDGNFGDGWTCKAEGKQLTVEFGTKSSFDDKSTLTLYTTELFTNPCFTDDIVTTGSFEKQPPTPKGTVKGMEVQSLACGGDFIEFYIDEVSGSAKMPVSVQWSASVNPENLDVTNFVKDLTDTRINIPTKLFVLADSTLTITATITNPMKKSVSSTFKSTLLAAKQMNVLIDKGSAFSMSNSDEAEFNPKLLNTCGSEDKSNFVWTIASTTSTQFQIGEVMNKNGKKKLKLEKNFLPAGNTFEFKVTVTSGSLTGSASIKVTTVLDDLIAIVDKKDGNISPLLDLTIDGSQSYDPSGMGYELVYQWSCLNSGTEKSCVGADGELLLSNEVQSTLNIPATRLVGGSALEIHFKVGTSGDSRTTEEVFTLNVYEGLSTNINMVFNEEKIEPSYFLFIEALVTSNAQYTLKWTQTQGPEIVIETDYTPTMLFWPYTFTAGETYAFELVATEEITGAFATSSISFVVNQPAECVSDLTISPLTGVSLTDVFTLSIDSCSDLDETDIPLTYTFAVLPTDFSWIYISKPQSFNSISFLTFQGEFYSLVRVCDTLGGCNWYFMNEVLTVTEYAGGRRLADEDPLTLYQSLVADNYDATILYGISVLNTFTLTADEVDYIYDDAVSYAENETTDKDILDMMMKLILQIIENQNSTVSYSRVQGYTELIMEMVNNCTEDISSDVIDVASNLAIQICEVGQYELNFVTLANDFLDQITSVYATNMLPGNTIINTVTSNLVYYKFREVSSNYKDFAINLEGNITVTIESLPFDSSDLIDVNIKSFPYEGSYSNILDITFTKCGTFSNNVLETSEEEVVKLTTDTVLFELPYLVNTTGSWACQYYDGNSWETGGCDFEEELNGLVKMRISHTTMFRLYDSNEVPSSGSKSRSYGPVILISLLTLILISGYTVCYFLDRQLKEKKINESPVIPFPPTEKQLDYSDKDYESPNKLKKDFDETVIETRAREKVSIFKLHLVLGLFKKDPNFTKSDRILSICLILATQFAIQGALIGYSTIDLSWVSSMVAIAVISVLLTIPLHFLVNSQLRSRCSRACSAIVVLGFLAYALDFALIIAMSVELTARHNTWIMTFFWGLLFETITGVVFMGTRYLISRI